MTMQRGNHIAHFPQAPAQEIELGEVSLSKRVATTVLFDEPFQRFVTESLLAHQRRNWGCVSQSDWVENEAAALVGDRMFSVYEYGGEVRVWIITEPEFGYTSILFPGEY